LCYQTAFKKPRYHITNGAFHSLTNTLAIEYGNYVIIFNFFGSFFGCFEMLGQTPEKQGVRVHIAKWAIASYL
jgi:hypothetical protein